MESEMELPQAPRSVEDAQGSPRFGTYQGSLEEVALSKLGGAYRLALPQRLSQQKKWVYTFVATPEVLALFTVVDLGYGSTAFVLAVDLRSRKLLVDQSWMGLPSPQVEIGNAPAEGLNARFRGPGVRLALHRDRGDERYHQSVELTRLLPYPRVSLSWRGELLAAGAAAPVTVISPISGGGRVNVTQKSGGMLASGSLKVGGNHYRLDGGVGGIDYTQGILARRTAWHWAFAQGRLEDGSPIGLNLVEGFSDESERSNENVLWVGSKLVPLAKARFTFNRQEPLDPWTVTTVDGAVALRFRPIAAHREVRDFKLLKSAFVQPVGFFEGTIQIGEQRHRIQGLPGVVEDQDVLW